MKHENNLPHPVSCPLMNYCPDGQRQEGVSGAWFHTCVIVTITTRTSTSDVINVKDLVTLKSTEGEHIEEGNRLLK